MQVLADLREKLAPFYSESADLRSTLTDLARKIRACFFAFDFPLKDAWKVVCEIANAAGTAYNEKTFEVEAKREAEVLAKAR